MTERKRLIIDPDSVARAIPVRRLRPGIRPDPPVARVARTRVALRSVMKEGLRRMRGQLTQQQIADLIDSPQSSIARSESPDNDSAPSLDTLVRVAIVTGQDLLISIRADGEVELRINDGKEVGEHAADQTPLPASASKRRRLEGQAED